MTVIITRMSEEMRARRERMGMLTDAQKHKLGAAKKALAKATADMVRAKVEAEIEKLRVERAIIERHAAEYRAISKSAAFAKTEAARKALQEVADAHGLTVPVILSERRTADVVAARVDAIALVAERTEWPLEKIGRFFNRHHATIIYSLRVAAMRTGKTLKGFTPEDAERALVASGRIKAARVIAVREIMPVIPVVGLFRTAKPERATASPDTLNTGSQVSFQEAAE